MIGMNCTSRSDCLLWLRIVFIKLLRRLLNQTGGMLVTFAQRARKRNPLKIKVGGVDRSIDLGAERLLAAERGEEKIAVEVKSFLASASAISEFHTALGQFINYRAALRREDPDRILYLAVPDLVYNSFFQLDFPASMLQENSVKIIFYDIELEQILLWKE